MGATTHSSRATLHSASFNPRSRGGSDCINRDNLPVRNSFNPRSRGGSDYQATMCPRSVRLFQSTLPWWERHSSSTRALAAMMFQSTLPWWERPSNTFIGSRSGMFQSTLPWWERHATVSGDNLWYAVSIHAPVVGATNLPDGMIIDKNVSIHAPVVGATFTFGACRCH